jgi:hypothetical protein
MTYLHKYDVRYSLTRGKLLDSFTLYDVFYDTVSKLMRVSRLSRLCVCINCRDYPHSTHTYQCKQYKAPRERDNEEKREQNDRKKQSI